MFAALLVALSLALVPGETEALGFKGVKFGGKKPKNTGFKKTVKTHTSRARCTAVSKTHNFAFSKSVHVRAVAYVWKNACRLRPNGKFVKTLHDKWVDYDSDQGEGRAFARAIATAKTTCNSSGNAYGCASAYAFAQAWSKATAKATGRAWATAIAKCKCDGKTQVNAAQADVWAREHKKLIAKVQAVAEAHVCTKKGGGKVSAFDAQTCIQDVYAWVYAQAIAKAAIKGKCVSLKGKKSSLSYGKFTASALADAQATVTISEIKGCVPFVFKG